MSDYSRVVKTQAELDQAIADGVGVVEIRSDKGVWIDVTAYGSATVTARGSATVTACDSATVMACDSATVRACDSATVTAYGSATVTAYGSATVTAYGSATVTARGSATVRAYGSATVTAGSRVAVHLHSGTASIAGGVIIDHTKEPASAAEWCAWHDVPVTDGIATLYKAVNDSWTTDRGVDYSPGATPEAPDWEPDGECGGGLHFSPTPVQASAYFMSATRFVEVGVRVDELSPILGGTAKAKAKRVVVGCREVTIGMAPVDGEVVAS